MSRDEVILSAKQFLFPAVFHYYREPLVIERGKNQYVWDADGRQYLDFFGGIVTISVGHANDYVNGALHEQLDRLGHTSTVVATRPQVELARKVASLTPRQELTQSFFTNSGTEANETAVLAARCYTGCDEIVALRYSYHGRSALGMALSANSNWRIGPATQPGIVYAHNAYCYRCPFGATYPGCGVRCARDLEELIRTTTRGRIAGMIAEPIQGVGGYITPPGEYFAIVSDIVRKFGGVFISDEVQTGWGRTGDKWFGIEQYGVTPDVITAAKGLGNGFPIGLTTARAEIAASVRGLTLSTFGGNPLATTAGCAVIEFIEQNGLRRNCAETGAYLHDRLLALQSRYPLIGDVRGMGLLQAIELVNDRESREPAVEAAAALMEEARERGVLLGKGGLYGNCIRLSPPMNIGRDDVDHLVAALDGCFAALRV